MKRKLMLATLVGLGTTHLAMATPREAINLPIQNGTTSAVLADDQDPKLLWVLPSTDGTIEKRIFTPGVTLDRCKPIHADERDIGEAQQQIRTFERQDIS